MQIILFYAPNFLLLFSYFDRDVCCVREFFKKRFGYESDEYPKFSDLERDDEIDTEVACSGYKRTKDVDNELLEVIERGFEFSYL